LVALARTLADELAQQYAETRYRDDDFVFGHRRKGSRLDADWYTKHFRKALAAAGIEGRVRAFHDMRHTALTNLAATGASPVALMATAGHRSMSTTKQNVHLAGVVFRDEATALEQRLLGGATHPVVEAGRAEPHSLQGDHEVQHDGSSSNVI
jgi:integrase